MSVDEQIQQLINKPYIGIKEPLSGHGRQYVCWQFCREIFSMWGIELPKINKKSLKSLEIASIPCIVLFKFACFYHAGIVWPDGLHFIHAGPRDIMEENPKKYIIKKDRLTGYPWRLLIEGYYSANV